MNVDILNTITIIINMKTNVFIADMKIFRGVRRMKRRGRVCLTLCLFGSILLNSCGLIPGADNKHPDFQTEYTIEEHIDRIRARTEENFSKEIQVGKIVNIEIEILYAFYDSDPEYFMVELEYAKEFAGEYTYRDDYWMETPVSYTTKYKHFIGFI